MQYQLKKYFENMINHQFYEAHEDLEKIWFPRRFEKDSETLLLKGFINAAVSFQLYSKGKTNQSKKVFKTYLKYINHLEDLNESKYINYYLDISILIQELRDYFRI